jgi:ATP-dependent Clp protease ATP-binding subunit ClpC
MVEPPSKEQAVEILKGCATSYEAHHRVQITDDASSGRRALEPLHHGRFLPDKAIDVIDEAGARVRIKLDDQPPDLQDIDARSSGSTRRRKRPSPTRTSNEGRPASRQGRDKLAKKKETIQKRVAREGGDEETASSTRTVIAEVVSKMTGIPLTRLDEGRGRAPAEDGGRAAQAASSARTRRSSDLRAVRRSARGLKDPKRRWALHLPRPLGRRQDAAGQGLAEFMFGDEDAIIQIDMSEYMEKHNVSA